MQSWYIFDCVAYIDKFQSKIDKRPEIDGNQGRNHSHPTTYRSYAGYRLRQMKRCRVRVRRCGGRVQRGMKALIFAKIISIICTLIFLYLYTYWCVCACTCDKQKSVLLDTLAIQYVDKIIIFFFGTIEEFFHF